MVEKTKQCSKCEEQKLLSEFYKCKRIKDGFRSECKKCSRDCVKKYQQTHKTEKSKYGKKYRKTIIGCLHDRFGAMKRRCNNPKDKRYKDYGGRGIKCLFKSSQEFVDYVIDELKVDPRGLQIDRIDNNGNYEPGNIRFVTQLENSRNKKRRLITIRQEQALRLCHHNMEGLSQYQAAIKMGISQPAVNKLLAAVKKVLPDYFPILTKLEIQIYHYYMAEGWPVDEIAQHLNRSEDATYKTLQRARDKGMYFTEAKGRVLSYDSSMDADVKQKF